MKTISLVELKEIDDTLRKAGMQIVQTVRVKLGATQNPAVTDETTKPVQEKPATKPTAGKAVPTTSVTATGQNTGNRE